MIDTLTAFAVGFGAMFAVAAAIVLIQSYRLDHSFHQKWGIPRAKGAEALMAMTEGLIGDGKDWDTVERAAGVMMNDLCMLESRQTGALATIRKVWERNRLFTPESVLNLVEDIRANIHAVDAPQTKAVIERLEKIAREARLNNEPTTGEQLVAIRASLEDICDGADERWAKKLHQTEAQKRLVEEQRRAAEAEERRLAEAVGLQRSSAKRTLDAALGRNR
jgi:hypothetical protein